MRSVPAFALSMGLLAGIVLAQEMVPATGGNITITPFQHASLQLEHAGNTGMARRRLRSCSIRMRQLAQNASSSMSITSSSSGYSITGMRGRPTLSCME